MRNPPTSSVIASYTYSGPPLGACGNPTVAILNGIDGQILDFLNAIFDADTSVINI